LWRDAVSAPRIAASGFEHPVQLGATFLADAGQLRRWYGDTPVLTDDYPKRFAPATTFANPEPEYAAWLKPGDARRRFQESQWVARHWPARLTRVDPSFFAVQSVLNGEVAPDPILNMRRVDAILRHTDLRIPVLWLLGSDITEQEIVNRRLAAGGYRPEYAYPLGVRALAERNYARAGKFFGEVARRGAPGGALAAYSMCRAGLRKQAAVPGADKLAPGLRCWSNPATR
jgi:hypothetical protein